MQIVINLDRRSVRFGARLAALIAAGSLVWWISSVDAAVPNTFTSGTVISASQVNANFTDLDTRVTAVDTRVTAVQVPIGTIIDYWTFGGTLSVPAGYELCNGGNVTTSGSPILGMAKPNLSENFIKGTILVAEEGITGGEDELSLTHSHGLPGHSHPINDHQHGVNNHSHGVVADASPNVIDVMPGNGALVATSNHVHNGLTDMSGSGLTQMGGGGSTQVGGSGSTSPEILAGIDNEPPFVVVLKIIRVR